jgi:hypothetical protein
MVGLRDRKPVQYCEASDDEEPRPCKRRSPGSSPDRATHTNGILKLTNKKTLGGAASAGALGDVTNKQAIADGNTEAKGKTFARKTRGSKPTGPASPKRPVRASVRQRAPVNYRYGNYTTPWRALSEFLLTFTVVTLALSIMLRSV